MHKGRSVEVIMPAYNEGKTIFRVIRRVLRQKPVDRLIIVYDKSDDATLDEIKKAMSGAGKRCRLVYSREKKGKGHAVRQGLELVGESSIVIIQDADEEYYPEDYPKLLRAFGSGSPVFGVRVGNSGHRYVLGDLATKVHTGTFNLLYRQKLKDINGAYKVFLPEMLKGYRLKQDGWPFDQELATRLAKNGYTIKQVGVRYKGRTFDEGKKIGPRGAIEDFFFILADRFRR